MMTTHKHIFVAVAFAVLTLPGAALAQSRDSYLADTVDRLERQLQTLERTVYRGAPAPSGSDSAFTGDNQSPAALPNLQINLDALEERQRRLTGHMEKLEFQVRQLNERMDRLVGDVDFRLRQIEDARGAVPFAQNESTPLAPIISRSPGELTIRSDGIGGSQVFGTLTESQLRAAGIKSPISVATAPDEVAATPFALPAGSAQDQYSYARQFLLKRDFANAEQALAAFIAANPEDALAGNAQYWLGETFYVRGDYQTAARNFAEGFQRYPDSGKAPDNLLKLGMSLAKLKQQDDACITLKKLRVEYPEAPNSIIQRADREIGRLQCS